MKLPMEIVGRNKIRDAKILSLYTREAATMEEIAERFHISTTRVHQLIYRNKALAKIDKDFEKLKRLSKLKRLLRDHPSTLGKKDTLDIIDQMRIETEGNRVEHLGQIDTGTKVIIIHPPRESGRTEDRSLHTTLPI